jgi:hypothetical protein
MIIRVCTNMLGELEVKPQQIAFDEF